MRVSMPLVVSMTTTVVMTFTDRVFLANYSIDAIAAALPPALLSLIPPVNGLLAPMDSRRVLPAV
jgi:Na+-driven multidrug efflux pump